MLVAALIAALAMGLSFREILVTLWKDDLADSLFSSHYRDHACLGQPD